MTRPQQRPLPKAYKSFSDEELVVYACKELPYQTRAYEELMRRHERLIFGVSFRLLGNRHDAEDVTQDVMFKIYTKISTFEGRSLFKTWLVRVTRNTCTDWLKKKAISKKHTDALAKEPQEELTENYEENQIIGLLNELSPPDREVLTLRFVADLSLQEISETTELSLSATKMRLYRAIERLQELAEQTFGEDLYQLK